MTMSMRERRKRALMMYNALSGSADYPAIVAAMGYSVHNWAADDISTLFQDSAGSTPVTANNDPVGRWVDRVQAVSATQGATAAKATYKTATLNGFATLSFDGGDLLATANISITTFAIWVVYRASAGTIVYEHSANVNTNNGLWMLRQNAIRHRRAAGDSQYDNLAASSDVWRVARHTSQGTHATHQIALNNVLQSPVTFVLGDPGTAAANTSFNIGARSGAAAGITGSIAQLIIVSPYPTASIITNMESFVNGKWAVY